VLATAALLTIAISWARSFQVDEVEHLHVAFNLRRGLTLYADFWEGHNPLLYGLLYPLADPSDPVASYRAARLLGLVALFGTALLTALAARRLGAPGAGVLGGGLLILHTTFIERGIEVRPDPWVALTVVAALAVEVGGGPKLRRFAWQALLLSAAFLFSQKAALLCIPFGALWLWSAVRDRRWTLIAAPMAIWALPVAGTLVGIWSSGALDDYLRYNVYNQLESVSRSAPHKASFSPWRFISQEWGRNILTTIACVGGFGWAIVQALRKRSAHPSLGFAIILAAAALGSLWVNPFPFPYLHVGVLPLLIVFAAVALNSWFELFSRRSRVSPSLLRGLCLLLVAATVAPRLFQKTVPGNTRQLQTLSTVQAITTDDDTVFDLAGLYARPDAYPVFVMTTPMFQRYQAGQFPRMIPLWRENELTTLIDNYRVRWLKDPEASFLDEHLVYYGYNVFVLGTEIDGLEVGASLTFDALKTARFRYFGPGELLVDGRPFAAGEISKGEHSLTTSTAIPGGRLMLDVPPPAVYEPPRTLFSGFD
jgi:hypothetical protein